MNPTTLSAEFGGRTLSIETGRLAKQAGGSVMVRYGDTMVLVTTTATKKPMEGLDFLPLTVIYQEKAYSAGQIPGGYFKREGRPSQMETLISRFIDRPIRPLLPGHMRHEVQVVATVMSADEVNEADVVAMIGASASLAISEVPFAGPIAGVRVGRINGEFVCNPAPLDMDESDIDLLVAATEDAIVMVEGGGLEVSEADMIDAIMFAQESMKPVLQLQKDLAAQLGKEKLEIGEEQVNQDMLSAVKDKCSAELTDAFKIKSKQDRNGTLSEIKSAAKAALVAEDADVTLANDFDYAFKKVESAVMRGMILDDKRRIDGRSFEEIRPITVEVEILPRAHGSALFTRGETQALVAVTLGSADDAQMIDSLQGTYKKRFMLHYNFPPFSVGEVRRMGSPGRREIGHGALAERAVRPMIPVGDDNPYTIMINLRY